MQATVARPEPSSLVFGGLRVRPFAHPQGCRSYLLVDPSSRQAMAVDPHLDLVEEIGGAVARDGLSLAFVLETHTHADHPSGAAALAARFGATRVAHSLADARGIGRRVDDGDALRLGERAVVVRHAPGHTPDHVVLLLEGAILSGDSLFLGGVARTDFLGGDAGSLFDSLHEVLDGLPDRTTVFPGHDYEGRTSATLGEERARNPWLAIGDRAEFAARLAANPPPRPANMDDLLRFNRGEADLPARLAASVVADRVAAGGAASVLDVRTAVEVRAEHVAGSRFVPLVDVEARADEIRAMPAPRWILCRTGRRAEIARAALAKRGVGGLCVVEGGLEAWKAAGGPTVVGKAGLSLERQVRIAAGSLALVGATLALLVDPLFAAVPAFIGAGLVFAGLTDWCGMGLLLARMPWNRGPVDTSGGGAAAGCSAGGCAASSAR